MVFAASPLSMWRLVGSKSGQWSDMSTCGLFYEKKVFKQ